jgi:hypothetical protein
VRHLSVACQNFSVLKLGMRDVYDSARRIRDEHFKVGGRAAFVANGSLTFGMLRAFQMLIDAEETKVMSRHLLSEAIHWLGLVSREEEIVGLVEQFEGQLV